MFFDEMFFFYICYIRVFNWHRVSCFYTDAVCQKEATSIALEHSKCRGNSVGQRFLFCHGEYVVSVCL